MDKLLQAVSLCRKAGKLAIGFDAVHDLVLSGRAKGVFLASDLSAGTSESVRRFCGSAGIGPEVLPRTRQQLEEVLPKQAGVLAVSDPGLAHLVRAQLEGGETDSNRSQL